MRRAAADSWHCHPSLLSFLIHRFPLSSLCLSSLFSLLFPPLSSSPFLSPGWSHWWDTVHLTVPVSVASAHYKITLARYSPAQAFSACQKTGATGSSPAMLRGRGIKFRNKATKQGTKGKLLIKIIFPPQPLLLGHKCLSWALNALKALYPIHLSLKLYTLVDWLWHENLGKKTFHW